MIESTCIKISAIALSYPPRVRVRAMVKLSAAFFHDESSIAIGGVRKCNSASRFLIKKQKNLIIGCVYKAS